MRDERGRRAREYDNYALTARSAERSAKELRYRRRFAKRDARRGAALQRAEHVAGAAVRADGEDARAHFLEERQPVARERDRRAPPMRDRLVDREPRAEKPLERLLHARRRDR